MPFYRRIENAEGCVLIAVYLFIYLFVCVLLAELKKYLTESHEIQWDDWLLSGDHLIRFWDRSGQSHEKVKIFFFIQLACNCQNFHNSMPKRVICNGMRSTSARSSFFPVLLQVLI